MPKKNNDSRREPEFGFEFGRNSRILPNLNLKENPLPGGFLFGWQEPGVKEDPPEETAPSGWSFEQMKTLVV